MLEAAIKAGIPVMKLYSNDRLNDVYLVKDICKRAGKSKLTPMHLHKFAMEKLIVRDKSNSSGFLVLTEFSGSIVELYEYVSQNHKQAILIVRDGEDESKDLDVAYDVGDLLVEDRYVIDCIGEAVPTDAVKALAAALRGIPLKDVPNVLKITAQRDKALTVSGVMETRSHLVRSVRGLNLIGTDFLFYQTSTAVEEWLTLNKKLFVSKAPIRLMPRGLLFTGQAGTGKSLGAKYVASVLGIPLVQLDLGSMMGKYVGESEKFLGRALSVLEQISPCVLLIDEVEKIFAIDHSNDVSLRMMSKLLWWLQEHKFKIITVMTTNNMDVLPEELYRAGRVDRVIEFAGLSTVKEIEEFIGSLRSAWEAETDLKLPDTDNLAVEVMERWGGKVHRTPSHAYVTQFFEDKLKELNFT